MIKNLLLSLLGVVSTLAFNFEAHASLNYPDNSFGSVFTPTFNQFIDATSLAEYKGWGTELSNLENCITSNGHNSSNPTGYPYFKNKFNNCLGNKYESLHGNQEANSAINEADFLRGRICSGSNCNTTDETLSIGSANESDDIKIAATNSTCISFAGANDRIANASVQNGSCRGTLKKTNFSSFQKYYNTLPSTLQAGDTVRVFTYLHNNAMQGVAANTATNVNVNLNWNGGTVTSTITANNAPTVTDTFNYNLPAGLTFKPKTHSGDHVTLYRNGAGAISSTVNYTYGNSLNIPMGTVQSSFGGAQRLYVDFVVAAQPAPNLTIEKSAQNLDGTPLLNGSTISAGDEFLYVITAQNTGNQTTEYILISDTLPSEVDFVSYEAIPANIITNPINGQTVSFMIENFGAGVTHELKIKVKLKDSTTNLTTFCNEAYLDPIDNSLDNLTSNNICLQATVEDPNVIIKKSQLQLPATPRTEMPNGTTLSPDTEFLYEIEIENNGPVDTQSDVIVTDLLDENIEWVDNNGDSNIVYEAATHKVTINFGVMGTETMMRRSFKVKLKADTPNGACHVKNIADFSYDDEDGTEFQSGTSNEVCVSVENPDGFMKLEKWAKTAANAEWHKSSEVTAGEVYEYRIIATNNSTVAITNVQVTDTLNSNLTFDSSSDTKVSHNGTNPGGIVTIDFGDMPAQTGNIAHFKVKVADPIAAGTTIPNNIFDNKGYCDANDDGTIDADKVVDCGTIHTVKDSDLSIVKSAQNLDGTSLANNSTINNGTEFLYVLTTKNTGTETIEYVSITDTLPNEVEFISFENVPGYIITSQTGQDVSFVIENFGAGATYDLKIKVKLKDSAPSSAKFCNIANLESIEGDAASSNEICLNVDGGTPPTGKLEITKETKTIANKNWHKNSPVDSEQDGDNDKNYLYKITVDNTFSTPQKGITVTDQLDERISFVELVPYDANDKNNTSSADTELLSESNPINFLIGTIPANGFKQVVFKVKVETKNKIDTIPNVAKLLQDGKFIKDSNTTTHTVTGGGSSSSSSKYSTGICHKPSNSDGWSCTKAIPMSGTDGYNEYYQCKTDAEKAGLSKNKFDIEINKCLDQWLSLRGFSSCDPDKNAKTQCEPEIENELNLCVNTKGKLNIKKSITKINGEENTYPEPYAANGDTISYKVETDLYPQAFYETSTNHPILTINPNIKNVEVVIHDIIVSSESGFVWTDRNNGISGISGTIGNTQITENMISVKPTNTKDHMKLAVTIPTNELSNFKNYTVSNPLKVVIKYDLKTSRVTDANTCEVTNTAFAVATVKYSKTNPDGTETRPMDSNACGNINEKNDKDVLQSLGDKAFAKLRIVKPFIETKSGNLCADGSNKKTNGEKKSNCGELNNSIPTATIDKKITKEIGKNSTSSSQTSNKRLGKFSATESNNGIYFLNDKRFEWKNQGQTLNLGRSETFIINGSDLVISENLVSTSADYIPAFIVKGGNIIIDPEVTKIEGVFIALEDEIDGVIQGGEITSTGRTGTDSATPGKNEEQLVVSGNLIGDAKKLFISRRFIGDPNNNNGEIQPSVKIVYDLRVFEQTPPGLNNFLGHNWKQEIE